VNEQNPDDLSNLSMLQLFQDETENQAAAITAALLELERDPRATQPLEVLMRAAHSLKGAARIINLENVVDLAHAMEDCFVAVQQRKIILQRKELDILFQGVDLLLHISKPSRQETTQWEAQLSGRIGDFLTAVAKITAAIAPPEPPPAAGNGVVPAGTKSPPAAARKKDGSERVMRVAAENLNRLLGLAGESLVESRWLHSFSDSLLRLKRMHSDMLQTLGSLRDTLRDVHLSEHHEEQVNDGIEKVMECRQLLSDHLVDLEMFDRRSANLSHRLYLEVLQCRMRPFGDGVRRLPRMVRDLAQRFQCLHSHRRVLILARRFHHRASNVRILHAYFQRFDAIQPQARIKSVAVRHHIRQHVPHIVIIQASRQSDRLFRAQLHLQRSRRGIRARRKINCRHRHLGQFLARRIHQLRGFGNNLSARRCWRGAPAFESFMGSVHGGFCFIASR